MAQSSPSPSPTSSTEAKHHPDRAGEIAALMERVADRMAFETARAADPMPERYANGAG